VLHQDVVGSVVKVTDGTGAVVSRYRYEAFGAHEAVGAEGYASRLLWQGREYDAETGLYYFRARYYAAALGRFISEDPISAVVASGNVYVFASNDPVNNVDPWGLVSCKRDGEDVVCEVGGTRHRCPATDDIAGCQRAIARKLGYDNYLDLVQDRHPGEAPLSPIQYLEAREAALDFATARLVRMLVDYVLSAGHISYGGYHPYRVGVHVDGLITLYSKFFNDPVNLRTRDGRIIGRNAWHLAHEWGHMIGRRSEPAACRFADSVTQTNYGASIDYCQ
jgi:RHS repeat-associated protein